jgi:uncharacterized protein
MPSDVRALPRRTRISAFCGRSQSLELKLAVAGMSRLVDLIAGSEGELKLKLAGRMDAQDGAWISGEVSGALSLLCERCAQAFDWPLQLALDVRVVAGEEEEARVIGSIDTWLAESDEISLADAVEDEVILALPLVAHCDRPDCSGDVKTF